MKIYMAIDNRHKEQLPVAVADSQAELAKLMRVKVDTVKTELCRWRRGQRKNPRYIEVSIDEPKEVKPKKKKPCGRISKAWEDYYEDNMLFAEYMDYLRRNDGHDTMQRQRGRESLHR